MIRTVATGVAVCLSVCHTRAPTANTPGLGRSQVTLASRSPTASHVSNRLVPVPRATFSLTDVDGPVSKFHLHPWLLYSL